MNQINAKFGEYTTWLNNPYVSSILTLFLIVYASMAAPKLPHYIKNLFKYTLFKLVIFFLIIYHVCKQNFTVALYGSITLMACIMILDYLTNEYELMEVSANDNSTVLNAPVDNVSELQLDSNALIKELQMAQKLGKMSPSNAEMLTKQIGIMSKSNNKQLQLDVNLLLKELQMAQQTGDLSSSDANMLAKQIQIMATAGKPVLVARTEEGGKQLTEIAHIAGTQKNVSPATARRMAAQVVIQEVVGNPRLIFTAGPNDEPEAPYFQNLWADDFSFKTSDAMKAFETDLSNEYKQAKLLDAPLLHQNEVHGSLLDDIYDNNFSNDVDNIAQQNNVPVELELAKEVIRRKQVETDRRGGFSPSKEEIQNMCTQVIAEYRNNGSQTSSCYGSSCSLARKQNGDVRSRDVSESSYASLEDN